MKTKEEYAEGYINYLYRDVLEHEKEIYAPDIHQTKADFKAGFNLAEELFKPKWINVETPPDDERNVIIKIFDYRRPKENVTDITLGYFENGNYFYDSGGHVNDGNGWMIISYMEFTQ